MQVESNQGQQECYKLVPWNTYSSPIGLRSLAAAEVAQRPSGISKHAQLAAIGNEAEERLEGPLTENVVTACRAITSDVAQGPDSLLANIRLGAAQEFDEDGHGAGLNDHLCLGCGAGGNIGQSPSGLELDQSVRRPKKFHKAADHARLDDFLDGRVAFFGEEFAEFGSGLDLGLNLI